MFEVRNLAVLLADLTGSTTLYETLGNETAAGIVARCRDDMRLLAETESGEFIHFRGDDVLCVFDDAAGALRAARHIVRRGGPGTPGVHAGLAWGEIIMGRNEVFGDAVNLAARLSATSNPGEVLMSHSFVEKLPEKSRLNVRPMDRVSLKGKAELVEIYGAQGIEIETQMTTVPSMGPATATQLTLSLAGEERALAEGDEVSIGRDDACQMVIREPHVSRQHAAVSVRGGLVEFVDQSSTGSFLRFGEAEAVYVRRKPVVLSGQGAISLGVDFGTANGSTIEFEVSSG